MSRLFELFTGEFVRITLVRNHKQSIEHKGTIKVIESPMVVEGFLVEEDEDYFYLGMGIVEIGVAVGKDQMLTMEIVDPSESHINLLDEFMEGPDNKGDLN